MSADNWTAAATVVIAAFTIILAIGSGIQAWLTRQAINLARAEFLATHRPRIRLRWITSPATLKDDERFFRLEIVIANVGESVAIVTECWIYGAFCSDSGAFSYGCDLADGDENLPFRLQPGESCTLKRVSCSIVPQVVWDRVGEEIDILVVDGIITYRDEVGIVRTTGFARSLQGERGFRPFEARDEANYED
jgi:hypothetical protein